MRIVAGGEESVDEILAADFDDVRAKIGDAFTFDGIGIRGEKDSGADAERFCGEGHGGAVIAGAGGGDLFDGPATKIGGQGVKGAARFERVGGELDFEFEMSLCFAAGEGRTGDERRHWEVAGKKMLSFENRLELWNQSHATSGTQLTPRYQGE